VPRLARPIPTCFEECYDTTDESSFVDDENAEAEMKIMKLFFSLLFSRKIIPMFLSSSRGNSKRIKKNVSNKFQFSSTNLKRGKIGFKEKFRSFMRKNTFFSPMLYGRLQSEKFSLILKRNEDQFHIFILRLLS
jgi:hypothetical protein